MRIFGVLLLLVATSALAPSARAQVGNLQRGLPTDLEDTETQSAGAWNVQGAARWERTDDGKDRVELQPQVQYGVTPALELRLAVPFLLGSAHPTTGRDRQPMGVFRLLDEAGWRPAVATLVGLEFPTGVRSAGVDTELT